MGPVVRISGRESLSLAVNGLTSGEAAAVRDIAKEAVRSISGAGPGPAPSLSPAGAPPELLISGAPDHLRRIARGFPANLAGKIDSLLDNYLRSDYKIDCGGKI